MLLVAQIYRGVGGLGDSRLPEVLSRREAALHFRGQTGQVKAAQASLGISANDCKESKQTTTD